MRLLMYLSPRAWRVSSGYIAFLRPRTFVERLTAIMDGGFFCHCELMVSQNLDGTWQTISSLPKTGVRLRNVTLQGDHWVKIPVTLDIDYCLKWYELHKGHGYDWAGSLATKIPFANEHKDKWFCSEVVATLLKLPRPQSYSIKDLYNHVK